MLYKTSIFIFLLSLFFNACVKNGKLVKEVKPTFFNGKVEHFFTHEPLEGIEIEVIEVTRISSSWFSSTTVDAVKDTVKSDNRGEFNFKIDSVKEDKTYIIKALITQPFDSTKITSRFFNERLSFSAKNPQNKIVYQLFPCGYTNLGIGELTWNSIPSDTIIVETPYSKGFEMHVFVRKTHNAITFRNLDANKFNTFKFFYVHKGIPSKIISREFYAFNAFGPYKHYDSFNFNYDLSFD